MTESKPIELKEGVDFATWQDTKLGNVPYQGEFEPWHEPPPIVLKRQLPAGSQLEVSYFHTHVIHEGQVCGAIGDAEFEKLLKEQAAQVSQLFPVNTIMMSHDEIRVMGWTKHSIAGLSPEAGPAELLTHNAKVCYETLQQTRPNSRVIVWSDMFDPYHNAVDKYYLVNGSLKSAALPRPVWVMNWNSGKMLESLQHFEKLGHRQIIAGYYDEPVEQIDTWLDTVKKHQLTSVQGVMYTTWQNDYKQLEKFIDRVKSHPAIK